MTEKFNVFQAVEAVMKELRAQAMPTEKDALGEISRACQRLRELGWQDAVHCPKDGTPFQIIEAGSIGIFDAQYQGEWPTGTWSAWDGEDSWPSRPIMFRLTPPNNKEEAK